MPKLFNDMPIYTPLPDTAKPTEAKVVVKPQAASPVTADSDKVELSTQNTKQKEKKGPIKTLKKCISNFKKFFATTGEYIKGTVKGIVFGASAGAVIYTGGELANNFTAFKTGKEAVKKAIEESTTKLSKEKKAEIVKIAKEGAKKIKAHKYIAAAVGVITLIGTLWNSSLNASEKRSDIEHKYEGHKK